ncbi:uncharacterized protein EDB93DRAFT_1102442 [Suillus bovinus]|uniref:uncharacterized protein n=1 Tax=Suillus bovinus TaxID=48563 RepID=UPI001B873EB9|nr:uncharacterized protein EDB93DRAFT_1102442 [Suillus bovinus]KAG2154313.1 hypothetical protein EDB93DRAFT_1102442 [Suillus bovinus]
MSVSEDDHHTEARSLAPSELSGAVPTSIEARAKCRIAALEEELQVMRQERGTKQRKTTYYVSQGHGDMQNCRTGSEPVRTDGKSNSSECISINEGRITINCIVGTG